MNEPFWTRGKGDSVAAPRLTGETPVSETGMSFLQSNPEVETGVTSFRIRNESEIVG